MKTVSFLGFSASSARFSEMRLNSSFSTGRQLNSSLTCPSSAVCSENVSHCSQASFHAIRTRYCLPHIRLPPLPLFSPPRLALHVLVKGRASLPKHCHPILRPGDILLSEDVCVLCHVLCICRGLALLLQGVVFGDILVIGSFVESQAGLEMKHCENHAPVQKEIAGAYPLDGVHVALYPHCSDLNLLVVVQM